MRNNLILISFFLAGSLFSSPIQFFYNLPPNDHPNGLGLRSNFIEQIQSAQKSIECAIYQINDEKVIQAWGKASKKGVSITLITDSDWYHHSAPEYQNAKRVLKEADIPIIEDKLSHFMHNKYCIFDRGTAKARVWMGSANSTFQDFLWNANASILFKDKEIADIFYEDFKQMASGKFQRKKEKIDYFQKNLGTQSWVEFYFSPYHDVEKQIVKILNEAKESIHFATYTLDNPAIYQALMDKHQKVEIYGIFNQLGLSKGPYGKMLDKGMSIRISALRGALHHKFMIVDKRILILGSYNFSANAEHENDESLVIIRDPFIANQFYEAVFVPTYKSSFPEYFPSKKELEEFSYERKNIRITEILFNAKEGVDGRYVEIYNDGDENVDMTGWKLWNGNIPWHDTISLRGTTDELISYYNDPLNNSYHLNHREKGYFLKPDLQILKPKERALIVGRNFKLHYLDSFLNEYKKRYAQKPIYFYEYYPKLFVCSDPSDKVVGDKLRADSFITLFYPDKFTVSDRFDHNEIFRSKFKRGQALERKSIDTNFLNQPYQTHEHDYDDDYYFLWYGLPFYNKPEHWALNSEESQSPGF